jgi:aminoglycoside phosphotransferase (APT) family kinase protein
VADETAAALAARVRGAFPDLAFSRAALIEKGEDHQVLVLDDRYVFRFPRYGHHPTGLKLELAVLRAMKGRCALPMPDYRYVSPAGEFAGYEMITGAELTPARFAALTRSAQERVLEQVADFLSALHTLPLDAVALELGAAPDAWPSGGSLAESAADGRARRLGPIARAMPDLAPLVDSFYTRFAARPAVPHRLTHSDVTCDHLMLAPSSDRLAGIIDFGDVELGDPAYDFAYLWSYSDWAPAFAFDRYGLHDQDPGLLDRGFWLYARYRIARLGEALDKGWMDTASEIAATLPTLLAEFPA